MAFDGTAKDGSVYTASWLRIDEGYDTALQQVWLTTLLVVIQQHLDINMTSVLGRRSEVWSGKAIARQYYSLYL